MPCYTVQTSTVKMDVMDREVLAKALEAGKIAVMIKSDLSLQFDLHGASCLYQNGQLTIRRGAFVKKTDAEIANALKVLYSTGVVKTTAAKMGWKLTQKAPNQFKAQKGWR
ncbi:MAG: hypothetical protein ACREI9_05655 [Nitrospiraceae bacterium]